MAGRVGALDARRIFTAVCIVFAPAAAAGAVAGLRSGHPGSGIVVGLGALLGAWALERRSFPVHPIGRSYPLHLMPLGGMLARALALLAGVGVVVGISQALAPIAASTLVLAVTAGWIVMVLTSVWVAHLERRFSLRVAVVGSPGLTDSLVTELELGRNSYCQVLGWIAVEPGPVGPAGRTRCLGSLERLDQIVSSEHIDLLVDGVAHLESRRRGEAAAGAAEQLLDEVMSCGHLPVKFIGANEFFENLFGHAPLATIDAEWFHQLFHPGYRSASPLAKRTLGVICALLFAAATAPLLALAALAIKLEDGGPVFYRQRRVGERGRAFDVIKLRTMRPDAESTSGIVWALLADDRVTRVGRLLRRLHIDELPQMWNVIRGEMALVGPRPERPEMVAELEKRLPFYGRRALMRPGVTGWAQVRCGYAGSVSGSVWKLAHDLYYLKRRSIVFDAMIMLETLLTLIPGRRAATRVPDRRFVLETLRKEDEMSSPIGTYAGLATLPRASSHNSV
jgi:exopolysaccharide biosynthesis polyprenyl glycosylphosphotransferase